MAIHLTQLWIIGQIKDRKLVGATIQIVQLWTIGHVQRRDFVEEAVQIYQLAAFGHVQRGQLIGSAKQGSQVRVPGHIQGSEFVSFAKQFLQMRKILDSLEGSKGPVRNVDGFHPSGFFHGENAVTIGIEGSQTILLKPFIVHHGADVIHRFEDIRIVFLAREEYYAQTKQKKYNQAFHTD
jgi:hypothetical protein